MGSVEGFPLMLGWELMVRTPRLLTLSSSSCRRFVSGARGSSFHGKHITFEKKRVTSSYNSLQRPLLVKPGIYTNYIRHAQKIYLVSTGVGLPCDVVGENLKDALFVLQLLSPHLQQSVFRRLTLQVEQVIIVQFPKCWRRGVSPGGGTALLTDSRFYGFMRNWLTLIYTLISILNVLM